MSDIWVVNASPLISLGVIVRAKLCRLVPSAATIITQLKAAGLYLDDDLVRAVLQQVGEAWPSPAFPDTSTSQGNS